MRVPPPHDDPPDRDLAVVRALVLSTLAGVAAVLVLATLATFSSLGVTAALGISVVGGIVTASISATAVYFRRR